MDKLKDYIPLVIIAISFIYSFVKKANKTKENKEETMLPGTQPQTEDWENTPKQELKPEVVFHRPERKKKKQEKTEVSIPKKNYQEIIKPEIILEETPVKETEENPILLDLQDNIEEVKKAVIYSEIFNRKY